MNFDLITREGSRFVLLNGTQEIANIKYNRQNNSFRIHSAERRLFFLNHTGLMQNKILFTTEYGVTIGENNPIKNQHKGALHIGENKFTYSIEKNVLDICDKRKKPLINFRFNDVDALGSYEVSAVVFGLAWLYIHSEINGATAHKALSLYAS